jgi:hypothetical protein
MGANATLSWCGALLALGLGLASTHALGAEGCKAWSLPEHLGNLDVKIIPEASGIAVSHNFPGRLYHNNDSGDGPNFYFTDMAGTHTETVKVSGFDPIDVEDIALGGCGRERTCLFLGDIGDNQSRRDDVKFVLIGEKENYGSPETPLRIVTARYPDGPHNAEAFAIHPDGDLYLITKAMDWFHRRAGVAQVFKLTAEQLSVSDGKPQTFTEVADLDLPWLLSSSEAPGQIVTALDIAPDGKRFAMLTYDKAVQVELDLSKPLKPVHSWQLDVDYRLIETAKLNQQEGLAYLPDGGIIYSTESGRTGEAPLYRQTCTAR